MATADEHSSQAQHNLDFAASLDRERFPDWIATGLFYAAVHLVEAMMRKRGIKESGSHTKRNKTLRAQFQPVWREYQPLWCFSRLARYRCLAVKTENLEYIERRFRRLELEVGRVK